MVFPYQVIQKAVDQSKKDKADSSLKKSVDDILEKHEFHTDRSVVEAIIRSNRGLAAEDVSSRMFDPAADFGWDTVALDGFGEITDM